MLTAAVRDLHRAHPGKFQTDVRTSADALWVNNPHLTRLNEGATNVDVLDMHYPLIHESNQRPYHFIHGYPKYLEKQLDLDIPVTAFQGDIHLSQAEKERRPPGHELGVESPYWVVVAGGKYDFTAKWWNPSSYQKVVDHFQGKIRFVQIGEKGHWHPRLANVVDLVGKTDLRQLVRLIYHADGVLCPVTLAMHLAAAVETKNGPPGSRPCVVIAGGREPPHWEAYPRHRFLSNSGALACCVDGGCWKSRCQLVGDGDSKDRHDVCEHPVQVDEELRIPKCMEMIRPDDVIHAIETYYDGGVLRYLDDQRPKAMRHNAMQVARQNGVQKKTPKQSRKQTNILIRFRHGLGDAVQLTIVLKHLAHYHPDWSVDVAALIGKHSAFFGQCRKVFTLDRDDIPVGYDQIFDLDWHENSSCYENWPSTKAERCLLEVFRLTPIADLCSYQINVSEQAAEVAEEYLKEICSAGSAEDGRYPAVLIHYEGNTSGGEKNLSHELVRKVCQDVIECGYVPVILDWDGRSPLIDHHTIHNPHVDSPLWGRTGTGDAEVLTALTELSSLMIGVDSGPLHIAGATNTPTIAVWTHHHPLHYFGHVEQALHLVPSGHEAQIRGNQAIGQRYFERHFRKYVYHDLTTALRSRVRKQLGDTTSLVHTRDFWIRCDNTQQDLVVVEDIWENDSYGIGDFPKAPDVVVDVGAHIGCFAKLVHKHNQSARVIAVECCPENLAALEKNVGGFAEIVPAAMTYESDVALLNAVYPDCVSTGGSTLVPRDSLREQVNSGKYNENGDSPINEYWADFREIQTVTLEDVLDEAGIDFVDVLKLDCEGSEFSILGNTTSLDRIGAIVGEYHGKESFLRLVKERFPEWELCILRDGELGTFWLQSPSRRDNPNATNVRAKVKTKKSATKYLVSATRNKPSVQHELLVLEGETVAKRIPAKKPRFTWLDDELWMVEVDGTISRLAWQDDQLMIERVSQSEFAREAHCLRPDRGRLAVMGTAYESLVHYDPKTDAWTVRHPFGPIGGEPNPGEDQLPDRASARFNCNSVLPNGDEYLLSVFTLTPRPANMRWRDFDLTNGAIVRWGRNGFDAKPVAKSIYAPHSLRRHRGNIWWCESFKHVVCRDDGWKSPDLGGFTRGLRFQGNECVVGLSRSRIASHPHADSCGVCRFSLDAPENFELTPLSGEYIEVYDVLTLQKK